MRHMHSQMEEIPDDVLEIDTWRPSRRGDAFQTARLLQTQRDDEVGDEILQNPQQDIQLRTGTRADSFSCSFPTSSAESRNTKSKQRSVFGSKLGSLPPMETAIGEKHNPPGAQPETCGSRQRAIVTIAQSMQEHVFSKRFKDRNKYLQMLSSRTENHVPCENEIDSAALHSQVDVSGSTRELSKQSDFRSQMDAPSFAQQCELKQAAVISQMVDDTGSQQAEVDNAGTEACKHQVQDEPCSPAQHESPKLQAWYGPRTTLSHLLASRSPGTTSSITSKEDPPAGVSPAPHVFRKMSNYSHNMSRGSRTPDGTPRYRRCGSQARQREGSVIRVQQRAPTQQKLKLAAQAQPEMKIEKLLPADSTFKALSACSHVRASTSKQKHQIEGDKKTSYRYENQPFTHRSRDKQLGESRCLSLNSCTPNRPDTSKYPSIPWSTLWATPKDIPLQTHRVSVLRSVFAGRPPVLIFSCCLPSDAPITSHTRMCLAVEFSPDFVDVPKMFFSHTKATHEYNAVLNTLQKCGFERARVETKKWSICWGGHPKPEILRTFNPYQKTNHFPRSWQLGRKDLMWRNIRSMQRKWPQDFDITPQCYVLPDDLRVWMTAQEQHPSALWIWKPVNSSCGRGIKLLRSNAGADAEKILRKQGVIQKYVERPLLLNGYKFDLRLYVVVTSFDPLKIYLNSEGLVRLATEKYTTSPKLLHCRTMHLTNYSINKHAEKYVQNMDMQSPRDSAQDFDEGSPTHVQSIREVNYKQDVESDADDFGCTDAGLQGCPDSAGHRFHSKWSLQELRDFFKQERLDFNLMMSRIKDVIIKSLIAVEPEIANAWHQGASFYGGSIAQALRGLGPNQTCFEIFGFDILIDHALKPWLLEVNTSPSLSSSSPLDKRIKTKLVADALTLVGVYPFDHSLVSQTAQLERENQVLGLEPRSQGSRRSHLPETVGSTTLRDLGEAEWALIVNTYDEFMRRGGLECIFPTADTVDVYAGYFESVRYANEVLALWLRSGGPQCFCKEVRGSLPACVPTLVNSDPY